jgi:hypothetical protein
MLAEENREVGVGGVIIEGNIPLVYFMFQSIKVILKAIYLIMVKISNY